MDRKEVFRTLHEVFTGKTDELHSTIAEYENLTPSAGLVKAKEYLKYGERGQENTQSDMMWWAYEGDITLAKLLIAIFEALANGRIDFPPITLTSPFLMDKQGQLQDWAKALGD